MMRNVFWVLVLAATTLAYGDEPMCATSASNDARLRALHERMSMRPRIAANAVPTVPVLREGAFYIDADDGVIADYRPFDLGEQSLVFEPRADSKFAVRREALRYIEPAGAPLRDFQIRTGTPWYSVRYDLGFVFPIFGRDVTTLYLTAFNGIHFSTPNEPGMNQFDALEAVLNREPLLSPLMITNRKPSRLAYPLLFVEQNADGVVITWRSATGADFGYDVQAELHKDGSVVYSYRAPRVLRWGTPVLSAGFDPANVTRRALGGLDDARGDLVAGTYASSLADMNDIRRFDVYRVDESELFVLRLQVAAAVNPSKLTNGESLRYVVQVGNVAAWLDVTKTGWSITPFNAAGAAVANGAEVRFDGDAIEFYGLQAPADAAIDAQVVVWAVAPSTNRTIDFASRSIAFDAPLRRIAGDLSSVANGSELSLPITEAFTLGELDPASVWERLQSTFALSSYDIDAVAIYQSFFTDIIFYAGAYSTGGNAGVDGIAAPSATRGSTVARRPSLLHMNQLTYGWNSSERSSSHVMLHELGHRWLYFARLFEGGQASRVLNPVSAHPAGYVHTPSAFRVWDDGESSVMGGAVFSLLSDGRYRAHAANYGYSWPDLYLMGLASPEEVETWFYVANTDPALPKEYWPADGATVTGERRNVNVGQIMIAEGARNPPTATSQRMFRVLFVLVTGAGGPADEEVAKINEWRALLEKTFTIATGGRARVTTDYARATKKRALR